MGCVGIMRHKVVGEPNGTQLLSALPRESQAHLIGGRRQRTALPGPLLLHSQWGPAERTRLLYSAVTEATETAAGGVSSTQKYKPNYKSNSVA